MTNQFADMTADQIRAAVVGYASIAAQILVQAAKERRIRERGSAHRVAELTAKAARCQALSDAAHAALSTPYREELTPAGIQLSFVPAAEGKPSKTGAAQMSLF
jgi:hypothetical protein